MASNKRRKRYNRYSRRRKETNILHFIPILFIIAIVPLIMRGTIIDLTDLEQTIWIGQTEGRRFDIFSYWKSVWFVWMTVFSLLMLIWLHLEDYLKIRKVWPYYIPLGIYILFVFLSWLGSPDLSLAARGFIEIFQGLYVLIAYGVIIFVTMNMIRKEKELVWIAYAFGFVGVITFIIGFSQYFNMDVFANEFIQRFILSDRLYNAIVVQGDGLRFTFGPRNIYATMYNTNFVGSFAAMMVPLAFGLFLYVSEFKHKVYAGTFLVMMVFVWFGSNSRAGILGVGAAFVVLGIFMHHILFKQPKLWLSALGAVFVLGLILNVISNGRVANQFVRLNPIREVGRIEEQPVRFESVRLESNRLYIETTDQSLVVMLVNSSLRFEDLEGNALASLRDGVDISLVDEAYEDFTFRLQTNGLLDITAYGQRIRTLLNVSDDTILVQAVGGFQNHLDNPPRVTWLDGWERLASGRGYIFSRTIPMLRDTFFLGYGPDMYVLFFPQRDIEGRLNGFHLTGINDKPHNMFLQIGVNTGVISLIALMTVYVIYFFDSIKLYWKRDFATFSDYFGVSAFAGIFGYLVAGVFNDQIISVAPLFYTLTGIGIAINYLIKKDDESLSTSIRVK